MNTDTNTDTDQAFWERVDDLLDRRLDPLADEALQSALAERPELLAPLDRLLAGLALVAREPAPARPWRRAASMLAAASLVALGFVLGRDMGGERAAVEVAVQPAPSTTAPAGERGRVLSLRASLQTHHPDGRVERVLLEGPALERSREFPIERPGSGLALGRITTRTRRLTP